MKFCTHCGAQLPDGAKFCRQCGAKIAPKVNARPSDDGQGIVIDAPEGATVTISDAPNGGSKAPDKEGEFFIASWGGTEAGTARTTEKRHTPPPFSKPKRERTEYRERPRRVVEPEEPVKPAIAEEPQQSQGDSGNTGTIIKIALIIVSVALTFFLIKSMLKGDGNDAVKGEQTENPVQSQGEGAGDNDMVMPDAIKMEGTNGDIIVGEEDNQPVKVEQPANEDDGFQGLDNMPLHEKALFIESLLERTEKALQEEEAKGADADPATLKEHREFIKKARQFLDGLKQ